MTRTIRLACAGAEAEILPALGGTVRTLRLTPGSEKPPIPLLAGDGEAELAANPWFRGRIMFPFCDRIPDGRYSFDGREYRLPPNQSDGSAIHGLIWNRPGSIRELRSDRLRLRWPLGEDPGYPFRVALTLDYRLTASSFSLGFRVENLGDTPAPVGFGWHPYFTLPHTPIDALKVRIPALRSVEVGENLMPTGALPLLEETPRFDFRSLRTLGSAEFDLAFPRAGTDRETAILESDAYRIGLTADGALNYFQLFTPPDRGALALEPISNVTDAFNRDDMGALRLAPGDTVLGAAEVALSAR